MERIPDADPEDVLRAMEEGFRTVSSDLVREGHKITLSGLGPSPRAKNPRDKAVIDVRAENGITTIAMDITYQASAFLGNVPQNTVVQAKVDRIFDAIRDQLGLEPRPERIVESQPKAAEVVAKSNASPGIRFAAAAVMTADPEPETEKSAPDPVVDLLLSSKSQEPETSEKIVARIEPDNVPESKTEENLVITTTETAKEDPPTKPEKSIEPLPAEDTPVMAAELIVPTVNKPTLAPVSELKKTELPSKTIESASATTGTLLPPATIAASPKERALKPMEGLSPLPVVSLKSLEPADEEEKKSRGLQWSAWIAAVVVLVIAPLAWLYWPGSARDQRPAPQTQPSVPAAVSQPVPASAPPKLPGSEEDPAAMMEEWRAAMNSTDATKQAAFYADSVDRYFLRHDVSRDAVLADRQAQIDKRQGDWNLGMERLKVQPQPDANTASVRLVKHFTIRKNGKLISEWFVPSQILLKREDGRWQIISERDLGWGTSMEELGY